MADNAWGWIGRLGGVWLIIVGITNLMSDSVTVPNMPGSAFSHPFAVLTRPIDIYLSAFTYFCLGIIVLYLSKKPKKQ